MTTGSTLLVIGSSLAGAVVGALTPVPSYRRSVDYGEEPRVSCASCDSPLALSAALSARCGGCGKRLGPSRWWTVPAGALAFGSLAWAIDAPIVLVAALALAGLALPLAAIDLAVMRLPDALVLVAFAATVTLLTVASAVSGDWGALLRAAEGGAIVFALFFVLAILPGASLGFGDVKLGGVIGLLLAYLGWGPLLMGIMLPWLVNAPVAVVAIARRGRKADQPFGPALLAGSLLAVVVTSILRS